MELIQTTTTESTLEAELVDFSIKQSPVMFDILTNKLYSDPILAIIRELITNAYDSQVEANTTDIPIKIIKPYYSANTLVIRDYGTGLSNESMVKLYTTFFDSTKCNDNELTGGFGLGSKTPFAYTDSYVVKSFFNGKVTTYLIFKNNGLPTLSKLVEEDTNEHNGLSIEISIKDSDIHTFISKINAYLKTVPEVLTTLDTTKPIKHTDKYILCNCSTSNSTDRLFIKQGLNSFPLSTIIELCSGYEDSEELRAIYTNINNLFNNINNSVYINVPIGTFIVAPNRENLQITKADVIKFINILKDLGIEELLQDTEVLPYYKLFLNKYLVYNAYRNIFIAVTNSTNIYRTDVEGYAKNQNIRYYGNNNIFYIIPTYKTMFNIYWDFSSFTKSKRNYTLNKIKNICSENNLLVNVIDLSRICDYTVYNYVGKSEDNYTKYLKAYLSNLRKISKSIDDISCKCISVNAFIKMYKVSKYVKTEEKEEETIVIDKNASVRTHSFYENSDSIDSSNKSKSYIEHEIKNSDKTIVFFKLNKKDTFKNLGTSVYDLCTLFNKTTGKYSINSYLSDVLDIKDCSSLYFMYTSYKHRNILNDIDHENLIIINLDDFREYCSTLDTNNPNAYILTSRIYEQFVLLYFLIHKIYKDKKMFKVIKNTKEYKIIKSIAKKYIVAFNSNIYVSKDAHTVPSYSIRRIVNKASVSNSYVPTDPKEAYKHTVDKSNCYYKYVCKYVKQYIKGILYDKYDQKRTDFNHHRR